MCCVSESRCWQWGLQGCLLQEQAGSAPWWTQPALASSNRPTPQGTAEALSHGFKKGKNASWTEEKEWREKEGETTQEAPRWVQPVERRCGRRFSARSYDLCTGKRTFSSWRTAACGKAHAQAEEKMWEGRNSIALCADCNPPTPPHYSVGVME